MLSDVIGEYSIVAKVDVSNVTTSLAWYVTNLQLVHQPEFDVPNTWAQACFPENPLIAIGLNQNPDGVGNGGANTTFVVDDIQSAIASLTKNGISVSVPVPIGPGGQFATFSDPDGNNLGLRQNPSSQPSVASVKKKLRAAP